MCDDGILCSGEGYTNHDICCSNRIRTFIWWSSIHHKGNHGLQFIIVHMSAMYGFFSLWLNVYVRLLWNQITRLPFVLLSSITFIRGFGLRVCGTAMCIASTSISSRSLSVLFLWPDCRNRARVHAHLHKFHSIGQHGQTFTSRKPLLFRHTISTLCVHSIAVE